MTIQFLCPGCERSGVLPLPLPPGPWRCPRCQNEVPTPFPGRVSEGAPVTLCALCGGERFYTQRDFSQRIGCGVAALGAALSPFTYGLSLLVCLGIDLGLFFMLKEVTVCYRCGAIYRGVPVHPDHRAFDLHLAAMAEEERKYLEGEKK